jgi:hypothetical protein
MRFLITPINSRTPHDFRVRDLCRYCRPRRSVLARNVLISIKVPGHSFVFFFPSFHRSGARPGILSLDAIGFGADRLTG